VQTKKRERTSNPIQKSISKEIGGSSSKPLRIKRANKPLALLKSCAIFEEDEEPLPLEDPEITSLKNKITSLREDVRFLKGQVDGSKVKIIGLEHQLNICIFSFGHRLAKVARAARVKHALD